MKNRNLNEARKAKNDEFYTRYEDIEKEVKNYNLEGMWIYCPCDDYRWSNFVKYFKDNFQELKIRHLTATNYDIGEGAYRYDFDGREERITPLEGNGDFRSEECIKIKDECDTVITNPPFSLFREYVAQLMEYGKKFLIIGNNNAITYKEFFPHIKEGNVWLGRTLFTGKMPFFKVPDEYQTNNERYEIREDGKYKQVNGVCWFTNIPNDTNKQVLVAYKKYTPDEYPKYDNYDAIDCGRMEYIPTDWNGVIGIPITGLKYLWSDGTIHVEINGKIEQFEIVSFRKGEDGKDLVFTREMEEEFNENIKKKRFNRTFVSLFDFDTRDDKKCRRQSEWENYLRENNNKKNKVEEPIDYFFPNAMNVGGLMNNPKDTTILGKSRYARILIRAKH